MSILTDWLKKMGFGKSVKELYLILPFLFILSASTLYFFNGSRSKDYRVRDVIDGDTIIIDDRADTHLRYLEIDAPEILTDESPGDPLAEEARNLNRRFVSGHRIRLEFDREKYDAYGRKLAYVFVDGVFVNEEIVKQGLARAFIIKPNEKYADRILRAQEEAKREKRGIWGDLSRLNPPPQDVNFLVKPSQASRYIDQRVVVRGKITNFRKSDR
jgi:micrococcal nuclease